MGGKGLNQIKSLFNAALALPPGEREAWLRAECGNDQQLTEKLVRMLKVHDDDSDFLEHPPISLSPHQSEAEDAPETVGDFRIIQQIGEGGMGVVYLAEQTHPIRRRVALKLIKLGMDTKSVVARFNAERQALALLDHPNVARVIAAGANETGRPYFVMEYVPGEPITKFCDTHHLTLNERLQLFVQVCNAIQHAHHKGIIHRDIKPSNVLVMRDDGNAVPKVIDFGVAKATDHRLTEQTLFTEHGVLIGTPSYMSPEQADLRAIGVDARTDVYSLGVLLYEMIVGVLPFEADSLRRAGYAEIQRIIRDVEPSKPSTRFRSLGADTGSICDMRRVDHKSMHRLLSGDLDWITMKAIDKDPARRYAAASELAADIQRHLEDEPVLASPPSRTYRLRKFVRRHRGSVGAGLLLVATLIAGVISTSIGWDRALRAEREAATQAAEARRQADVASAVNAFLNNELLAAVTPSVEKGRGRDVLMRDVLYAAADRIEAAGSPGGQFADKPIVEAGIREMLGVTLLRLGEFEAAAPHLLRARQLTMDTLGPTALDSIRATDNLANLYQKAGRESDAEKLQREALKSATEALGPEHPQTLVSKNNLASLYHLRGRYAEAATLFAELVDARTHVLGSTHPDTVSTVSNLAITLTRENKLDEAETLLREWLPVAREALGESDPAYSYFLKNLGEVLARKGQTRDARTMMTEALEIRERVLGKDHPDTLTSMHDLAILASVDGDRARAVREFEVVARRRSEILGEAHADTISAMSNLANAYIAVNRGEDAERLLKQQLEIAQREHGDEHIITMRVLYLLGWLYLQQNRLDDSDAINTRLLQTQIRTLGEENPQTIGTLESVARVHHLQGRHAESASEYARLREILESSLGPRHSTTRRITHDLAMTYLAMDNPEAARPLLREWLSEERELAAGADATAEQKLACAKLLLEVEIVDLRDAAAALALASEVCDAAHDPNAAALTILALAQYRNGDAAAAIATQQRAIERLPPDTSARLRELANQRLTEFRAHAEP